MAHSAEGQGSTLGQEEREATTGFEPVIRVLQTRALPLGYVAKAKPAGYTPAGILSRAGDEIRTHDLLLGKETFYH
jgi:hypothetical protein